VSKKIPVLVIFAPTASGKTALTRELFSQDGSHFILNAEIISADSQSVYKYMDIGTAKPDSDFCRQIPHHLIDVKTPDQQFSVADFVFMADKACHDIYSRGKIPVICGGTGFYIRNFLFGLPKTPKSDEKIRNRLKERIAAEGNEALYAELKIVDPQCAAKIHVNDAYRICRALEVFYTTGKKLSDCALENKLRGQYKFLFLVLEPPRDVLFERIRERVDLMFKSGLEAEVEGLIKAGYTKETPGMKAIGYSEFFEEGWTKDKICEAIKHNSCKYAKKQYTYIRDIPESIVISYNNEDKDLQNIAGLIGKFAKDAGFSIDLKA
jgi:tRNA dimethylallyltransferase